MPISTWNTGLKTEQKENEEEGTCHPWKEIKFVVASYYFFPDSKNSMRPL